MNKTTWSVLTIKNLTTGISTEWTFSNVYDMTVYTEIRKAMHQQKDLTVILDTGILFIPAKLLEQAVLNINELSPTYPIEHITSSE
jgi:hypothetical protein